MFLLCSDLIRVHNVTLRAVFIRSSSKNREQEIRDQAVKKSDYELPFLVKTTGVLYFLFCGRRIKELRSIFPQVGFKENANVYPRSGVRFHLCSVAASQFNIFQYIFFLTLFPHHPQFILLI